MNSTPDNRKRFIKVKWSKRENELIFDYFGYTRDINYLMSQVINQQALEELKARGFDIKTLKFYIEKTKQPTAE